VIYSLAFLEPAGGADPADVSVGLQMVLSLEGVECRVK
jgi:hypothetical protein